MSGNRRICFSPNYRIFLHLEPHLNARLSSSAHVERHKSRTRGTKRPDALFATEMSRAGSSRA
jgi:hypothetical protein